MIWNEQFVWLHIPKTGGTTMSRIFKNINDPHLMIDDDSEDKKHDSEYERRNRDDNWNIGARKKLVNIRRLSSWLVSDWKHKRKHMKLPELPFEPVRSGLFYSVRLGGIWITADYWLKHLCVDRNTQLIRLEYLEVDFKKYVFPLTNPIDNTITFDRKENNIELIGSDKDKYTISGKNDLDRIYRNNPYWAEIERKTYQ